MGQQRALLVLTLLVVSTAPALLPPAAAADATLGPLGSYLQALHDPQVAQAAEEASRQLMGHQHSLSRGHLQRSLVFAGANLRLRRVLGKLLAKEPQHISVGVIGGSISWGHNVQRGLEDWFSLLQEWMRGSFPQHKLTFKNGCVPATQSSYVSSCLQQFVNADIDLVFIEYCTNDGYHHGSIDNSLVRAFERLLRKLLAYRHAPAVVLMEFLATDVMMNNLPFYATGEDQYGTLAQYYGLPWLSYRNAVWHEYAADEPGFRRAEIFPLDEERHPTPLGHRYLADIAIHLIQHTYMDSLLYPMDADQPATRLLEQVPPPMFEGNYESSNLICVVGEQLPASVATNSGFDWVNEGTAAKPKWGFVSWKVGARLVLKVDTRASVHGTAAGQQQQQRRHGAETLTPAAVPGDEPAPGAGSAPAAPTGPLPSGPAAAGADTDDPRPQHSALKVPDMIVWVGYLKSWRHMGSASLSCIGGCECQGSTVDGMHASGTTQQHMAKLYTTQAEACLIEVKINEWAQTNDHKFKVTALMVTHAVEFSGHGDFTDTVLLDNMAPNYQDEQHKPDTKPAGAAPAAKP